MSSGSESARLLRPAREITSRDANSRRYRGVVEVYDAVKKRTRYYLDAPSPLNWLWALALLALATGVAALLFSILYNQAVQQPITLTEPLVCPTDGLVPNECLDDMLVVGGLNVSGSKPLTLSFNDSQCPVMPFDASCIPPVNTSQLDCVDPLDPDCFPDVIEFDILQVNQMTTFYGDVICNQPIWEACIPDPLTLDQLIVRNLTYENIVNVNITNGIFEDITAINAYFTGTLSLNGTMACPVGSGGIDSDCLDIPVSDEGVPIAGSPHYAFNFNGPALTATDAGSGQVNVTVDALVSLDGVGADAVGNVDLVAGDNIVITPNAGSNEITISSPLNISGEVCAAPVGLSCIDVGVEEEGVGIGGGPHNTFNFVGPAITASDAGSSVSQVTVDALVTLDGVGANATGNVDLVEGYGIDITPNAGSNDITIDVSLSYIQLSSTTVVSTLSSTYTVISGMTSTPAAGVYFVTFSCDSNLVDESTTGNIAIFQGGTIIQHTHRDLQIMTLADLNDAHFALQTQVVVTLDGSTTLDVRFSQSGPEPFEIEDRSFILIKLSN